MYNDVHAVEPLDYTALVLHKQLYIAHSLYFVFCFPFEESNFTDDSFISGTAGMQDCSRQYFWKKRQSFDAWKLYDWTSISIAV